MRSRFYRSSSLQWKKPLTKPGSGWADWGEWRDNRRATRSNKQNIDQVGKVNVCTLETHGSNGRIPAEAEKHDYREG